MAGAFAISSFSSVVLCRYSIYSVLFYFGSVLSTFNFDIIKSPLVHSAFVHMVGMIHHMHAPSSSHLFSSDTYAAYALSRSEAEVGPRKRA